MVRTSNGPSFIFQTLGKPVRDVGFEDWVLLSMGELALCPLSRHGPTFFRLRGEPSSSLSDQLFFSRVGPSYLLMGQVEVRLRLLFVHTPEHDIFFFNVYVADRGTRCLGTGLALEFGCSKNAFLLLQKYFLTTREKS